MISRRGFLGMLGAGGVGASALLLPRKTIFLPPPGGWPRGALASMVIPRTDLEYYAEAIASGRCEYDMHSETMTIYQLDPAHHAGKFHSATGRKYDWKDDESGEIIDWIKSGYGRDVPVINHSKRADIDDRLDRYTPRNGVYS
jgi:hypothetical protein